MERKWGLLQSEKEALKPILTLEDLAKRLRIPKMEIKEIKLEGTFYKFPSPKAVESELLKLATAIDTSDGGKDYKDFLNVISKLDKFLKEVELCLVRMEQHTSQVVYEQSPEWRKDAEKQAHAAFREAEDVLKKEAFLSASEKGKIKRQRLEPKVPEDTALPEELFGLPEEDKPTLH